MCLHECLEQFNLFGFRATRERLRVMVGASGEGWTEPELLHAVEALADARRSRSAHLAHARESGPQWHNDWLETYLTGDMAVRWMVAGLGRCRRCDHPLIHHGTGACAACTASGTVPWEARCRVEMPRPTTANGL